MKFESFCNCLVSGLGRETSMNFVGLRNNGLEIFETKTNLFPLVLSFVIHLGSRSLLPNHQITFFSK
jgi:hypothetical protein